MAKPWAALVAATVIAAPALADDDIPPVVGGRTYAQHLAEALKAKHPEIQAIVVEGQRPGMQGAYVLASTASRADVFRPVAGAGASASTGRGYVVRKPYVTSTDHRIGTVTVWFASRPGRSTARFDAIAEDVAAQLDRATLSAKNASDPYPYDARFGPGTYAQRLTERTVARHPDLLVMMIHATPPNGGKNVIIGSNIGRLGKVADEDDLRVIDKGETNLEVADEKDRFETELPLNDARGQRIGALGLVFRYRDGEDHETIRRHGLDIRDEIARQIPNSAALFRSAR